MLVSACIAGVLVGLSTACTRSEAPNGTVSGESVTNVTSTLAVSLNGGIEKFLQTYSYYDSIRAVLVSVDGQPVVERYTGSTSDQSWNVASITKSVVSTLVGIAVAEHRLAGLDQNLATVLPAYAAIMRPEVAAITVRQLLTMTAGFPDTWDGDASFVSSPDWVRAILTAGIDEPPGRFFAYSDAGPHLLSAILTRATGQSVLEYARAKLFDPLGIPTEPATDIVAVPGNTEMYDATKGFTWPVDPQGFQVGCCLLTLRPADLLKLGQLYLDQGQWNGNPVLPSAWVQEATTSHIPAANVVADGGYGYLWWVLDAAGAPAFAAVGYGGQLIEVVPARRLVVVVSSEFSLAGQDPTRLVATPVLAQMVSQVIAPAFPSR